MASAQDFNTFADPWQENARLALDTITLRPTRGIPTWLFQTIQWSQLEELSGNPPGSYPQDPVRVYREFISESGAYLIWHCDGNLIEGFAHYRAHGRGR